MAKDKTIKFIENFLQEDYITLKDNLQKLLVDYKRKSARLEKIISQSDKQQFVLMQLNEELDEHKNHLEQKVAQEVQKREEKEKMLMQQAKLASMGEMMDAVAHQWKQPISIMSMQVEMLGSDFEDKLVDTEYVQEFQEQIDRQIEHMMSTLNEFRTFFRPTTDAEEFNVQKMIEKVLLLTKDEFVKNTIEILVNIREDFTLYGVENEFKHLVINIINNAKDAFIENKSKNRQIIIDVFKEKHHKIIDISDNAGGIPEEIISDIFKANVTTKEESSGTGIGLYMSSQIAQKHNGELSVHNIKGGAKFRFKS